MPSYNRRRQEEAIKTCCLTMKNENNRGSCKIRCCWERKQTMTVGRPSTDRSRPRPPSTLLHEIHVSCRSRPRHLQPAWIPVPGGDIMSDLESSRVLIASWSTRNHLPTRWMVMHFTNSTHPSSWILIDSCTKFHIQNT